MTLEESMAAADRILRDAGWKPLQLVAGRNGSKIANEDGRFAIGNIVAGYPPEGASAVCVVKDWTAVPQAMAESFGFDPADYPDEPHEAAQWMVEQFKAPTNPLQTEATLDPIALAQESEQVETPQHESDGETGEEAAHGTDDLGRSALDQHDDEQHSVDRSALVEGGGDGEAQEVDADFTDADFDVADLGGPDEALELPAPEPEDSAPDAMHEHPEHPEHQGQDRFIGLDDLDRVRSLRIGDVATEALRLTTLIEQAVSEQEGEFANIQAYVVSHLDKHTGAFTPQDDASRATYGRFLELSSARSKKAMIDERRKIATGFLLKAERDDVVNFDVAGAFV